MTGLFALAGSLAGAAYLGFAHWPWPFLAAWATIGAIAFLFDNRRSMAAAISDGRQPDDPRALALLSYATMVAGVVALSVAGESAIFFIAREVGNITNGRV